MLNCPTDARNLISAELIKPVKIPGGGIVVHGYGFWDERAIGIWGYGATQFRSSDYRFKGITLGVMEVRWGRIQVVTGWRSLSSSAYSKKFIYK